MLSPFIFLFLFTLILLPWIHYFHHIVRLLSRYLHVQIRHTRFYSTKWMLVFKKDVCGVFFKIIGIKSTKHFYGRSTSRICSWLKPTEHFFDFRLRGSSTNFLFAPHFLNPSYAAAVRYLSRSSFTIFCITINSIKSSFATKVFFSYSSSIFLIDIHFIMD